MQLALNHDNVHINIEGSHKRHRERNNAPNCRTGGGEDLSESSHSSTSLERPPRGRALRVDLTNFSCGCIVLSTWLRGAEWPHKLRPDLPERYEGIASLGEFLQIYSTAVCTAGSVEDVMANYFHITFKDSPRSWFMNLASKSTRS